MPEAAPVSRPELCPPRLAATDQPDVVRRLDYPSGREPSGNFLPEMQSSNVGPLQPLSLHFPKASRLTKAAEFSRVFSDNSLKLHCKPFLLLAARNTSSNARLGLVISRKNVGCAVARNRIKRLCREAFRHDCASLPAFDIVLLAKPGSSAVDNAQILLFLSQLFGKLRAASKTQPPASSQASAAADDRSA